MHHLNLDPILCHRTRNHDRPRLKSGKSAASSQNIRGDCTPVSECFLHIDIIISLEFLFTLNETRTPCAANMTYIFRFIVRIKKVSADGFLSVFLVYWCDFHLWQNCITFFLSLFAKVEVAHVWLLWKPFTLPFFSLLLWTRILGKSGSPDAG